MSGIPGAPLGAGAWPDYVSNLADSGLRDTFVAEVYCTPTRQMMTGDARNRPECIPVWAKLRHAVDGRVASWHSLIDHSCDVAAVMEALLDLPVIADRLARLADRPMTVTVRARLAALAFLHDIGKANRGFRSRWFAGVRGAGHIMPLAQMLYSDRSEASLLLAAVGYDFWSGWIDGGAGPLFDAIFAHHGRPWQSAGSPDPALWCPGLDMDPIADLAPIGEALPRLFPEAFAAAPPLPAAPAFHHAFAGLLMLADWLGSDEDFFPWADGGSADRMAFARARAPKALASVGLAVEPVRVAVRTAAPDFAHLFAVAAPRPVQQAAPHPDACCVVLEAETGAGKTEAALWRFLHLFRAGAVDGMYFALPTRVAATQAFARICRFADRAFGRERPAVVLAVPGQQMADGARGHPLPGFDFAWDDDPNDATLRARWAAEHPKRFLAAQIAVGTIDQALLGAIEVRHAHLRGAALLRQLLVVDEVHASDRYMERLLAGLLRGHLQAGGHALLLSATLGAGTRARLLDTKTAPSPDAAEAVPYPALTWREGPAERSLPIADSGADKAVALSALPLLDLPESVAARALAAAQQGAKVLVIRNTVRAAVATQRALEALEGAEAHLLRIGRVPTLHHGRFAPEDRRLLDAEVTAVMGKERPPGGLVVVGTQTLEVSLDIDADLLITDLCPVDVMLQRLGRLHRHACRVRPAAFAAAQAYVLVPSVRPLLALARRSRHGLGGEVYDDLRIIEATWRLIETMPCWRIPADNRRLVERATHPDRLEEIFAELRASDAGWQTWLHQALGKWSGQRQQAGYALLDRDTPFDQLRPFDTDDRLATRLGAKDRLLSFAPPPVGPFGVPVAALRVPAHLLAGIAPEAEPTAILPAADGGFTLALGSKRFNYDRLGLRLAA